MNVEARPLPETFAAIVFKGDDLDVQLLTNIMGQSPSLFYSKGQEYEINNAIYKRKFGLWIYSTENFIKSKSLKIHLDAIEEILIGSKFAWPNTRISKIRDLVDADQVALRIDVFWYGAEGSTLPKISRSFDQVVTLAGGIVATDFHRDGDAEEAAWISPLEA